MLSGRAARLAAVMGLVLAAAWTTPAAAVSTRTLNVTAVGQTQTNWCWAASNQMVMKYRFGITFAQCDQANYVFFQGSCCTYPSSAACNKAARLTQVRDADYYLYGKNATYYPSYLSRAQVESEINANRPFLAAITRTDGTGHVYVVRGYVDYGTDSTFYLYVINPKGGIPETYLYTYFVWNSAYDWSDTLYYYR